ncbi:Hypothetical predicted protein [Paramuricea clavata]|uniref:Uncharacterized protein n=1 Tax=Paramuricea clavata TaxID=317549 RepID=A0A6S7JSV4_PARCT|nr:Hypothetical predicted protein [Paramuricea clavata]
MLCRSVIGFSLKQLTTRKFYGNYFHNITAHAPIQNRLISGISTNTEEQERVFNSINSITRTTSSYHPHHIIGNVFIRLQAEKDLKSLQPSISDTQEAHVTKLASSLPTFENTVIPKQMLTRNPRFWQAHLERICDFLLAGDGIWWRTCTNGDIEFFDAKGNPDAVPQGPTGPAPFPLEQLQSRGELLENLLANVFGKKNTNANQKGVGLEGHCTDQCNDRVAAAIGIGGVESLEIGEDSMSESSVNVGVVAEGSVDGCDGVAGMDDVVGLMGEKDVVECNVRLVEVTNDTCLGNDFQEEANQDENVEDINNSEANNQQTEKESEGQQQTQTKQGRALGFVLGITEEVLQFDKARKRLKDSPNNNDLIKAYLHVFKVMETSVSRAQANSKRQLKEIEQQYFRSRGKLPTSKDMLKDPTSKLLIDKLKYCKALVDQWKEEKKKDSS